MSLTDLLAKLLRILTKYVSFISRVKTECAKVKGVIGMHQINVLITMVLLGFIMLPVSAAIDENIRLIGAHKDPDVYIMTGYTLVEAVAYPPQNNLRKSELRMFPQEMSVYRLRLEMPHRDYGKIVYKYFAALPESPENHINKLVNFEYSYIYNLFGRKVDVMGSDMMFPLPRPIGTPVYGKITVFGK